MRHLHESKSSELGNLTTATNAGNAYIAANKDTKKKTSVTIKATYDIESIRPGDLLTITNLEYEISAVQILKIDYNPDSIKLELDEITSLPKEVFTS